MDKWYDILPHLRNKQLVWYSQCSQLFHAISQSHLQHVQWKWRELWNCADIGDLKGVKYLVKRCGADVHARGEDALQHASRNGHLEVVKYFVEECGADVHAWDDLPLRNASEKGHLEVVRYLVEAGGADVHAQNDFALRYASYKGQLKWCNYWWIKVRMCTHATKMHCDGRA
jgi:hypothetical protein